MIVAGTVTVLLFIEQFLGERTPLDDDASAGNLTPAFSFEKKHDECAVFFGAFKGKLYRTTSSFEPFQHAMQLLRIFSPKLPILLFHTIAWKEGLDPELSRRLSELESHWSPYFQHFPLGSAAYWARQIHPGHGAEQAGLETALVKYPNPLKLVALRLAANHCTTALYFDADVLIFKDPIALFGALPSTGGDANAPLGEVAAPAEPCTREYCLAEQEQEFKQPQAFMKCRSCTNLCEVRLRRALKNTCTRPTKLQQKPQFFQSSTVVIGAKALQIIGSDDFLLNYFNIWWRVLDGSREFGVINQMFDAEFWALLPASGAPVPFPTTLSPGQSGEPNIYINEQIATYLAFACAGIRVTTLPMQKVSNGLRASGVPRTEEDCHNVPMLYHTYSHSYVSAAEWYVDWFQPCGPAYAKPLSWDSSHKRFKWGAAIGAPLQNDVLRLPLGTYNVTADVEAYGGIAYDVR